MAKDLVIRHYQSDGVPGVYVLSRKTGVRRLYEKSGLKFFEIMVSEKPEREGLSEMSAKFKVEYDRIARDYYDFKQKESRSLFHADTFNDTIGADFYKELEKRRLISVIQLELLYECNSRCIHCYIEDDKRPVSGDARAGMQKKIIDHMDAAVKGLSAVGCVNLVVSGGEVALLGSRLPDVLEKFVDEFSVTLLTNGTLWDKKDIQKIAGLGVKNMRVTMFSFNAGIHDAITRNKGSLNRTLQFIDDLRDSGVEPTISVPILAQNASHIPALAEYLNKKSLRYLLDVKIFPRNFLHGDSSFLAADEQLKRLVADGLLAPLQRTRCNALLHKLRVDPYGNVFPCEYLTEKAGNILDEGISSSGIIGSAAARDMLSKINLPPGMHNAVCKKCEIAEQCFSCAAFNHWENKDMTTRSSCLCRLNKAINIAVVKNG